MWTREQRSEYNRRYYAARREEWRQRYLQNREQRLEAERLRRLQNIDAYRARDHERYMRNRDRIQAQARPRRMLSDHGLRADQWVALWDAQSGCCYLCGDEMTEGAVIDHDHSCCPSDKSCRVCRRGLAHHKCNVSIGFADDNPERLHRMAEALEVAQLACAQRQAKADQQTVLIV